jgi:hypothetical protein
MARKVSTKPTKPAKRVDRHPKIQRDSAGSGLGVRMTMLDALEIQDNLEAALAELSHAARSVRSAKNTLAILTRFSEECEAFDG